MFRIIMIKRAMSSSEIFDVCQGLKLVRDQIKLACTKRLPEFESIEPTLVAVSKTKSVDMILEAYDKGGQKDFGENYVKELYEKGSDERILERNEIRWHFIGHLQTNKINKLLSVPNLYMVQTVDSEKLATALNTATKKLCKNQLNIMLQVNTSGEQDKNGFEPNKLCESAKYIKENCSNLNICGLMTIGRFDYDLSLGPNPDFLLLRQLRLDVCKALNIDWKLFQISMGMSDDFQHAIELGSTMIRVGRSIFGFRPMKK